MLINVGNLWRSDIFQMDVAMGTTLEEIYRANEGQFPHRILAAEVDNKLRELTFEIDRECDVRFLDIRSQSANLAYQNSLVLIYLKATRDVLGQVDVEVLNSLNKGLYTEIRSGLGISKPLVESIENRMREIIESDLLIEKRGGDDFQMAKYSLGSYEAEFCSPLAPSTAYVDKFTLRKYKRGLLLRFPHPKNPDLVPDYVDEENMYEAFSEVARWKKLLDISSVSKLNRKIESGSMREIIQLSEALHEKKIVEIASEICRQEKRIVLIAGPSSSGKTTFARRLCIQLAVNGAKPLYMGTDDYFVNRDETPLDENGEKDFENIGALDITLFNNQLNGLLKGQEVDLPEFDFLSGRKVFGKRLTKITEGQPIVIEGIHGLNDFLTPKVDEREKFKIYISPLTPLAIDAHNRIPTTDARMLRRLVRDHKFRGYSAMNTLKNWPKVRAGEDKNIFPYSGEADVFFNSVLIYELSILKNYALNLLKEIPEESPQYAEGLRMSKFLEFFYGFPDEDIIPNTSILREFIGGSAFL